MKTTNSFRSKLLALTLAFMASAMSFAKDGYPDFEVDGLYYNFLEGDSVQVTFQMQSGSPIPTTANNISNKKNLSGVGYGQLTELVVPSTVTYEDKTYHVSRIGIAAFLSCVNLAHIDFPTSIKSIGMAAFQSCHALSSITLNEGVESIELQVFANCIKLKEVTLPSTLKSMGRRVFDLSKSLSKVVCKATTPPTVEEDLLTGSGDTNISNATLYVPVQSLTTYQNTYPWNTFGQILPIEDSFQEIFPTLWGLERTEVEGTTMGFDEPYQMSFSQYTPTLVDGTWYLYDGRNYFREANNQILWYAPEFNITDAVLYDWTLEVGDTLPIYTPTFSSDAKRGTMFRVTDVSTIKLLDGKEYKKWTFSGGYEYVEGIGAINKGFGLYYCLLHNAHPAIYTSTKTICISKNGQLLYQMDEVEMLQNGFECMCELTPAYKDQWCNIWNVVEFDGMRFEETAKTWQYRLAQDTVIDNQIYTFVNCHWTADKNNKYRCAAVRFTEDKKVYVHYLGKEYLLYDFDVQVGDTLEVFAGLNNAYDCLTCTCVVNKVRYSKTNKAIIELSAFGDDDENKYYPFDLRWIEGVGADEGFLMGPVGLNGRVGGYSRLLMCAYQDHQLVYETDNSYLAQFNCEYNAGHEHSSPTLHGLHRTTCKEFIGYEGIHETSAIETGKEVLINDKFYKLWDKWLLREENDKIYVYSNKKDILLYDFTLEVGDSLRTLILHPDLGIIDVPIGTIYPIDTLIVTNISTVTLLDGKEYRKWSFNNGEFEYVKGIGCLDGNFLALAKDVVNGDYINSHLVCVSKNGQLLYQMDDAEMERLGAECLCDYNSGPKKDNAKNGKIGGRPTPTQWNMLEVETKEMDGTPTILRAETFSYTLENDSIVANNKTYYQLARQSTKDTAITKSFVGALHFGEDEDNRVYFLRDGVEYVLYDFTAEPGDTIEIFAGINNYPQETTYTHVVTGKDTLENGACRMMLEVVFPEGTSSVENAQKVWLAGLGSIDGIVHNAATRATKARSSETQTSVMLCAWRDDNCLYTTNHPEYDTFGCVYNQDPTGVENVQTSGDKYQKIIRDGHLYILRDNKLYDVLGTPLN